MHSLFSTVNEAVPFCTAVRLEMKNGCRRKIREQAGERVNVIEYSMCVHRS